MSGTLHKAVTKQPAAFAAQMDDLASRTPDPVEAMTMRVASDMMALLPKHASTAKDVATLMQALPNICNSIVETVAATAYQGDMDKARTATLVILRHALAGYEAGVDRRVHVVQPS